MRQRFAIGLCSALLLICAPTPAHAWWEFLEALSGPGPFRGVDVQGRVYCWRLTPKKGENGVLLRDPVTNDVQYETNARANFVPGLIITLCKLEEEEVRRAAIDVGVTFRWTSHDTRFAHSERIYMTTLHPAFSYNLFAAHPNSDYLDVAVGAGVYWFQSKDFSTFSGGFLEPIRLEFHPTTDFKRRFKKKSALVPVLRVGYLLFPGGFDTAKFNASSPTHIGADWAFKAGVFFDLEGFRFKS